MLVADRPITDLGPDFDRRWRKASLAFRRELITEIRSIYQMLEDADIPVLGTGSVVTTAAPSTTAPVAKKPVRPQQNSLFASNDAGNAPTTDNPFLPQSIRDRLQHSLAQPPAPLTTLAPGLKPAPYNAEPLNTDAIGLEAALRQRLGPVIDNLIESQLDTLRNELRVRLHAEMDQLIAEHLRK